jgi:membrane-bound serine protease (ClpP class)
MEYGIWPYILIALGFVLLVAELFLPTGGVLFVLAVAALVVGVGMTYYSDPAAFAFTLIAVVVGAPVFLGVAFYYWPKTPMGKRFFLAGPDEFATLASTPVNQELDMLRGHYGKTLSDLRPAGITDFNGRRVDTIAEGIMIEAGQWVRCIDVQVGKVIVRQVEKPPDFGDLDPPDLI